MAARRAEANFSAAAGVMPTGLSWLFMILKRLPGPTRISVMLATARLPGCPLPISDSLCRPCVSAPPVYNGHRIARVFWWANPELFFRG